MCVFYEFRAVIFSDSDRKLTAGISKLTVDKLCHSESFLSY